MKTPALFTNANIEIRSGVNRKKYPLKAFENSENITTYRNELIEINCNKILIENGSSYNLAITNVSKQIVSISKVRFPIANELDLFLKKLNPHEISFLRNGYQSWSTSRSYRYKDKPLRPRFKFISLATSNMANLPSNIPGLLSSEMYSVIMDQKSLEAMLVGQLPPFNQFFYIVLNIRSRRFKSVLELIYDFGGRLLEPGKKIQLDGILILKGSKWEVEEKYFQKIKDVYDYKPPDKNLRGWCSWYQYYNKISPDILYQNLKAIEDRGIKLDFFQIDDGYQKAVGDWFKQKPAFNGKMKELALAIKESGLKPGIWIAPFTVSERSDQFKKHPEFILKTESGKPIKAGYNPFWKCHYYGQDVTHPRFIEYLKEVVDTYVNQWGFESLKCDFLFTTALQGAIHHSLFLTSASILKSGLNLIRETAGPETIITGCGSPLPSGIGYVDAMRIGPDTGDFWIHFSSGIARTGSMVGVRNSIRNIMVRSPMHKKLWLNDPDCLMIRDQGTKLARGERRSQIDAITLSGGVLTYSDDFTSLSDNALTDMILVNRISDECFSGQAISIDVMNKELPEIFYNTAGYLGLFNFYGISNKRVYDLSGLKKFLSDECILKDIRNGECIPISEKTIVENLPPRGSRLFKLIKDLQE